MKKIFLIILFLFLSCGNPKTAHATYWYVDNAAAGSNNGTSWTDAWTALKNVVWGASGVQTGDTLWISGGTGSKTYNITCTGSGCTGEHLSIGASGSSGNPIYIKMGAAHPTLSAGHDGTVIFDCGNTYQWAITGTSRSYVIIDGGDGTYTYPNVTPIGQNTHRKLKIQNVPMTLNYSAINTNSLLNVKFLNFEISGAPWGLYAVNLEQTGSGQSEIAGMYIHNISQEAAIACEGSATTSVRYDAVIVHDNEIQVNSLQNNGTGPDGIRCSNGVSVYNNIFYGLQLGAGNVFGSQHQDLIQGLGTNWKVYNNVFRNPGATGIRSNCSATACGYWRVYNNVLEINDPAFIGAIDAIETVSSAPAGGTTTEFIVSNNTVAGFSGSYGIFVPLNASTISNAKVENNIIYESGGSSEALRVTCTPNDCTSPNDVVVDNNLIYKSASHGSNVVTYGLTSPYTQPTGYLGQPIFATYTYQTAGNDYHLSSTDTQAKNKGISFATYFTTDKDGTPRPQPQGGLWDIGAYELFVPSSSALTSITITNGGYIH